MAIDNIAAILDVQQISDITSIESEDSALNSWPLLSKVMRTQLTIHVHSQLSCAPYTPATPS